jgi:hypothetical protein
VLEQHEVTYERLINEESGLFFLLRRMDTAALLNSPMILKKQRLAFFVEGLNDRSGKPQIMI